MNSIAYQIGKSLYLNITNRCTNECNFCIRYKKRQFNNESPLWLEKEPSTQEILDAIGDPSKYQEVVFCGYGEPLLRLDTVIEVSKTLKSKHPDISIRIDTNGHANLFWKKNILPELKGLINSISVSLNAPDAASYEAICNPRLSQKAYPAIIEFIKEAKKQIPEVTATVVDLPNVDKDACRQIATDLGVNFRVRPYYEENYQK
ncbi:MAG: TatD family nuclease-associated radical SAM protein [Candidatus Saganbacteria bacterium]|nr:TatD family nuclease-associated radical SAM protein [Candidatus Saganbacteria bacterium]